MIRLSCQYIFEELRVFNVSEVEEQTVRGYIVPFLENIVEAVNLSEDEGYIWDVISRYEKLLKGNPNVESLANLIYSQIKVYQRTHRFDPRLKMRLEDGAALNGRGFVFVVMDLDATLESLRTAPADEIYADEMVSENPTIEELHLLEKAQS